jgi:hypothetical protein
MRRGNVTNEEVDEMFRDDIDVDALHENHTALGWAAHFGNERLATHLVKCGTSIERGRHHYDSRSPLSIAAERGHENVVRALVACGASINISSRCGWTPLMLAVTNGHTAAASVLLRAGADCAIRGAFGYTALHMAAERDNACVRLLLVHGANVDALSSGGDTPLWRALPLAFGAPQAAVPRPVLCARWLLAAGATVSNRVDQCGKSLLHYAVIRQCVVTAELLIDAGIDLNATAEFGFPALMLARRIDNDDVTELLSTAAQFSPLQRAEAKERLFASLKTERCALARDRLDLIRYEATEICIGLQSLELPAFVTLQIIKRACRFAQLATMHQIWSLVVAIKHFTC